MTDYTKYIKTPITKEDIIEEVLYPEESEVVEEVVAEEQDPIITGVVTGCTKLNVRENPYPDAEVVCIIAEGDEVALDPDDLYEDFYKVYTAAGMEGYCMKKYISVN